MRFQIRFHQRPHLKSRTADGARAAWPKRKRMGWFLYGGILILFVLAGICRADGGLTLGNPAEKDFNAPLPVPIQTERLAGRGAAFADQNLAQRQPEPTIRQVSTTSIWDNLARNDTPEMTFADWGVGPSQAIPSSPPSSSSDGFSLSVENNMPGSFGFGMGTLQSSPMNQGPMNYGGPNTHGIPYFTTETDPNARAFGMAAPNLPQSVPSGMNAYGYGYYDPNTGSLYTMPQMGGGVQQYPGMDPYAMYGGAMSSFNPMQQAYDYQYGTPAMNPNALPGWTGFYGTNNNLYGGLYNNIPSMNDPNSLYQALLQQEAIRREVEEEIAAEEETERSEKEAREKKDQWGMKDLAPLKVSSPLGKTVFSCLKTLSPFNSPTGPHKNCGRPLDGVSWLDRPYYFGGFVGCMDGSELVSSMIKQKNGGSGGLNFGYNFNEYWGLESRLHFSSIDIKETAYGQEFFYNWFTTAYPGQTVPPLTTRSNQLTIFDVAVHYYPLGDAQFRPFFKYGFGIAQTSFIDTYGQKRRNNTAAMPIGVGLRYWWNSRLAVQADIVDNIIFSRGVTKTQYNWTFTVGITYMFGGSNTRRPYVHWPRTPSYGSRW